MDSLHQQLETIDSKEDLTAFVQRLGEDLRVNGKDWENGDLPSFLESMAAWLHDADDLVLTENCRNIWQAVGRALYASRGYE